jgi:hypothetical protein
MDKKLLFKMLAIGLMAVLLLIPLLMVEGQISDRAQRQREVQDNIANSSAGEQVLAGPVLVVHYRVTVEVPAESEKTGPRRQVVDRTLLLPPSKLNLDGEAGVETRQVYRALAGATETLAEHRITPAQLAESDRRLADFVSQPARLAPSAMMQVHLSPVEPISDHEPICCGQQEKTAKNQICPAPSTPAQFGGMPARL